MLAGEKRVQVSLLILGIVLFSLLPVVLYLLFYSGVPQLSAQEARAALDQGTAVLVDVRTAEEYATGHVEGAASWLYADIQRISTAAEVPLSLQGRPLLLICNSGVYSALAVRHLRALGVEASNVQGGLQAWIASAARPDLLHEPAWRTATGELTALPYRESPLGEQLAAVAAYFLIKPSYMLLSLVLIVLLWKQRATELVALRWGLTLFLTGEVFCAVNTFYYFATQQVSDLSEYLHGLGMALCMGLVLFALVEGLDRRVLRYSDPRGRCALLPLCRACIKHADVPCGLRRLSLFLGPVLIVLVLMPFSARPNYTAYNTTILQFPYHYSHAGVLQLFEIRYCLAAAVALLAIAFLIVLLRGGETPLPARVLLAAGLGPAAFGFLRLALLGIYHADLVWFVFWEEVTELLFVAGTGYVLWAFRQGLLHRADQGSLATKAPSP